MSVLASGLLAFSGLRLLSSLLFGPLVDRFSAQLLLPFSLLPLCIGFIAMVMWTHPAAWIVFLGLAGVSGGANGAIGGAVWTEIYGVERLGAIRALHQACVVFATALAPMIMGWLMDAEVSVGEVMVGFALLLVAASVAAPRRRPDNRTNTAAREI